MYNVRLTFAVAKQKERTDNIGSFHDIRKRHPSSQSHAGRDIRHGSLRPTKQFDCTTLNDPGRRAPGWRGDSVVDT
ncbi:hypothetical protein BGLA2_1570020 [Burkholderia gladioli]|nr:hypothetical protein BGLA2_1570020 [Burkholderia gladioli]